MVGFSKGEIAVQKMAEEHDVALTRLPMLQNPFLSHFDAQFINSQWCVYVTTTDIQGDLWTSVILGAQGMFEVIDAERLKINLAAIQSATKDILYNNLKRGCEVGLLFLDTSTRRRFRLNGVGKIDLKNGINILIKESFGICPKYIQKRSFTIFPNKKEIRIFNEVGVLGDDLLKIVAHTDTFFLGTQGASKRVDTSHKGGQPSFVRILEDGVLKIPDYAGNSMFNSLGNIHENSKASLLFVDYKNGNTLQLTGTARVEFGSTDEKDNITSGGTNRFWFFKTAKWIFTEHALPVFEESIEYSPFNPKF